jgi:hypothetical protein
MYIVEQVEELERIDYLTNEEEPLVVYVQNVLSE